MSPPPMPLKMYHILHWDRLVHVIADGGLLPDAVMNGVTGKGTVIGIASLKGTRLTKPIDCHPGLMVGGCVPFYFCSRSIMLYVIHKANHPNLAYRGGQGPIVHLEIDVHRAAAWANGAGRRWAFSLGNASSGYVEFRRSMAQLTELDWAANRNPWFNNDSAVWEAKQAEFLVEGGLSWDLVERIGVIGPHMATQVSHAIAHAAYRPTVEVMRGWYY
jgi:hypothetical protein